MYAINFCNVFNKQNAFTFLANDLTKFGIQMHKSQSHRYREICEHCCCFFLMHFLFELEMYVLFTFCKSFVIALFFFFSSLFFIIFNPFEDRLSKMICNVCCIYSRLDASQPKLAGFQFKMKNEKENVAQ